ncbi:MAG: hypothetical protein M3388_03705 [Acidobacteriota bacterium]|nr:hypothetical protein [Acidobacteriota bacterium]
MFSRCQLINPRICKIRDIELPNIKGRLLTRKPTVIQHELPTIKHTKPYLLLLPSSYIPESPSTIASQSNP